MSITTEQIQNALRELIDPVTNENYVDGKSAKNIKVEGANISLDIVFASQKTEGKKWEHMS